MSSVNKLTNLFHSYKMTSVHYRLTQTKSSRLYEFGIFLFKIHNDLLAFVKLLVYNGGMKTPEQIIHEHHQKMGATGGKKTLEKYGKKHFKELRKKVGKKVVDKPLDE